MNIGKQVIYIWDYAFRGCSSLKSITISNRYVYIGFRAFEKCNLLTTIYYEDVKESFYNILEKNNIFDNCATTDRIIYCKDGEIVLRKTVA